jgi:hypothetical protein
MTIENVDTPFIAYRKFRVVNSYNLSKHDGLIRFSDGELPPTDCFLIGARKYAWLAESMEAVCEATHLPARYCYETELGVLSHQYDEIYCGFYGFHQAESAIKYPIVGSMLAGTSVQTFLQDYRTVLTMAIAETYHYGLVREHVDGVSSTHARLRRLFLSDTREYLEKEFPYFRHSLALLMRRYPNTEILFTNDSLVIER